jgi:hypothetical protein
MGRKSRVEYNFITNNTHLASVGTTKSCVYASGLLDPYYV